MLSVIVLGLPCALIAESVEHSGSPAAIGEKGSVKHVETAKSRTNKAVAHTPRPRVLVYWSKSENRWKPIPQSSDPAMRAARAAAREVAIYLVGEQAQALLSPHRIDTPPKQKAAAAAPAAQPKLIVEEPQPLPERKPVTLAKRELPQLPEPPRVELRSAPPGAGANQHPPAAKRTSSSKIDEVIQEAAARHGVDPDLVRAVIKVESNFNPRAVSKKGAMGLMQLMPETAKRLKVNHPFDPVENVDAGVRQLKSLLTSYNGDVALSLAAYNAGPGAVARFNGVPSYGETRHYTRQITQIYGDTAATKASTSGTAPDTLATATPTPEIAHPTPTKLPNSGENSSAAPKKVFMDGKNSGSVWVRAAVLSGSSSETSANSAVSCGNSSASEVRVYRAPSGVLMISDQ